MAGPRPPRAPTRRRRRISTRTQGLANAYMARIAEAVRGGYPKLAAALGDDAFDTMVAAYLEKYPSTRLSVRGAGQQLPEFLAAAATHPVWHGELALLDRAYVDVLDAPRVAALPNTTAFGPTTPIRLVPAHALIELTTTVDELWRAINSGDEPERPRELDWPRTVLVWRTDGVALHRAVAADEARALRRAESGALLADLCATFSGENPTARALDVVLRWIDDGVVCDVVA